MSQPSLELLDQIDTVQVCLQSVSDLIAPGMELQAPHLDGLAVLMDFLLHQQRLLLSQLSQQARK